MCFFSFQHGERNTHTFFFWFFVERSIYPDFRNFICSIFFVFRILVYNRKYLATIRNFCRDNIGHDGDRYMAYLGTVLIYIGFANIIGMFGLKPPTKDLSVTIALALMSIVLIEGATMRKHGFLGFFKHFANPTPIMAPMNVLEIGIRPLSLCLRLFGNVVAAFIIMELIKYVAPVVVPTVFSLYFDIFDGFLQAYIFVFLTSLFINEGIEEE